MMKCKFPGNFNSQTMVASYTCRINIIFRYNDEELNGSGNFSTDERMDTDPITDWIKLYWTEGCLVIAMAVIIIIVTLIITIAAWLLHKKWKIRDKETTPPSYWCK